MDRIFFIKLSSQTCVLFIVIEHDFVCNRFAASLPWACHLVVMVELACLSDPKSYAGGDLVPGGFNRAGLVEG